MSFISKIAWLVPLIFLSLLPLNYVVSETQLDLGNDTQLKTKRSHRWGRDPFYRNRARGDKEEYTPEKDADKETTAEDFLLSAIILRGRERVAIINNQIVRPGDKLRTDIVVSRILPHKVFLREGTRTIVLQVRRFGSN